MGSDHTGCVRAFHILSEAWYADANLKGSDVLDEISLGFYAPEGGTSGEMCIRWTRLGGTVTPQLTVFDDAWSALAQFKDVLDKFAELDSTNPPPSKIAEVLLACGFKDMTARTSPYPAKLDKLREYDRPCAAAPR